MHPNPPQSVNGGFNEAGEIDISFDLVNGAKSYVVHYSGVNQSDQHDAIFMGYTETNSWKLSATDVPALESGDKLYCYVQTFNKLGVGENDIEKASYLNSNALGSAWSSALIVEKE